MSKPLLFENMVKINTSPKEGLNMQYFKNVLLCLAFALIIMLLIIFTSNQEHAAATTEETSTSVTFVQEKVVLEIPVMTYTGTLRYSFSPDKGSNLYISAMCTEGSCVINLFKGRSTTPVKQITLRADTPTDIHLLAENCSGGYRLTITASELSTVSGLVIQSKN